MFAARVCDSVDLYGFNSYSRREVNEDETEQHFPYHYFDNVEGETGSHNFEITIKVCVSLNCLTCYLSHRLLAETSPISYYVYVSQVLELMAEQINMTIH